MRRAAMMAIKAIVSILLLWIAAPRADWALLGERLRNVDLFWGGCTFLMFVMQMIVLAVRWRIIVVQSGVTVTFAHAVRYCFIGALFNQTMPSTVGGDAARIWLLGKQSGEWSRATYSVLVDRALGLLALALVVFVCLPWTLSIIPAGPGRSLLLVVAALGLGSILGVFVLDAILPKRLESNRLMRHLLRLIELTKKTLIIFPANVAIAALSILIHVITIVAVWSIARSLLVPMELGQAAVLVPPIILVTAIPISIGGWGVRESTAVVAFSFIGLPQVDSLAVSVTLGIQLFLVGVVGGLLWVGQYGRRSFSVPGEIGLLK